MNGPLVISSSKVCKARDKDNWKIKLKTSTTKHVFIKYTCLLFIKLSKNLKSIISVKEAATGDRLLLSWEFGIIVSMFDKSGSVGFLFPTKLLSQNHLKFQIEIISLYPDKDRSTCLIIYLISLSYMKDKSGASL